MIYTFFTKQKSFLFVVIFIVALTFSTNAYASTVLGGNGSKTGLVCLSDGVKDCIFGVDISDQNFSAYKASIQLNVNRWFDVDDATLHVDICLVSGSVSGGGANVHCLTPIDSKIWPSPGFPGFTGSCPFPNDGPFESNCVITYTTEISADSVSQAKWAWFHIRAESISTISNISVFGRKDGGGGGNENNAINGLCSAPPNGGSYTSAPSGSICSRGTASSISGSGPWAWTCNGLFEGSNASCSASLTPGETQNAKYRCSGAGQCIRDDTNGDTTNSSCNNSCSNTSPSTKRLSLSVSGSGSVSSGSLQCTGSCNRDYVVGASVTLTASPEATFIGWGGDCAGFGTSPTCSGSMSVDRSVSANFQFTDDCGTSCYQSPPIYTTPDDYLTPSTPAVCGNGVLEVNEQCDFGTPGMDPGDCQAPQHPGTQCGSQDCRCHDVYAYPYPTPLVLLTVPAKPTGGTIVSSPSGINCGTGSCSAGYLPGTQITLRAYPDSSYWKFAGWTGVCAGTAAPICIFSITVPSAVSATFDLRSFQYREF